MLNISQMRSQPLIVTACGWSPAQGGNTQVTLPLGLEYTRCPLSYRLSWVLLLLLFVTPRLPECSRDRPLTRGIPRREWSSAEASCHPSRAWEPTALLLKDPNRKLVDSIYFHIRIKRSGSHDQKGILHGVHRLALFCLLLPEQNS